MKVYLITEEQIQKLYDAYTPGSRDFDKVIRAVRRQEVSVNGARDLVELLKKEDK